MKQSRKVFLAALCFLLLALVSFLFSKKTILGLVRQRKDEKAAEAYAQAAAAKETEKWLKTETETPESSELKETNIQMETETLLAEVSEEVSENMTHSQEPETVPEPVESLEPSPEVPSYVPITDDAYYERGGIVYTPEYAVGRIDCVLEIPCISLRRCVYTGTDEEIVADLDMWFTVSASGALIPGKTHYAIFGHNHTVQNLSFNRLAEVSVGDYFTLTKDTEVYVYLVTDMFAAERGAGRAAYAYNDALDPSLCYIFTCGRDYMLLNGVSTRYKDLIVEGTLWKKLPATAFRGEEENAPVPAEFNETKTSGNADAPEPAEETAAVFSVLRDALTKEQEKVRASHPSPVLTLNVQEGGAVPKTSLTSSFSWIQVLIYLTAGFAAVSVLLFLISLTLRFVSARRSRHASHRASA